MPIVALKWKPLDKLFLLWTVCLIHYRRERNERISQYAIKLDFGDETAFLFHTYCGIAMDHGLLDDETMQLTPKGLVACSKWKRISEKLYAFS
jgi:hypothetical protein